MYVAININQLKSPYHYFRSAFLILIMGSQHGGFIYIFQLQKFSDMPDPVFFLDQWPLSRDRLADPTSSLFSSLPNDIEKKR